MAKLREGAPATEIVPGEYRREDDVEIKITRTIPQPDKVEVQVFRVKALKQELEDIAARAAADAARKAEIEAILSASKKEIAANVNADEPRATEGA